jgi:hypothetical protein
VKKWHFKPSCAASVRKVLRLVEEEEEEEEEEAEAEEYQGRSVVNVCCGRGIDRFQKDSLCTEIWYRLHPTSYTPKGSSFAKTSKKKSFRFGSSTRGLLDKYIGRFCV